MATRWDAILLATAIAGGSMLIESSHRLDTGAPDEETVAASTCEAGGAERYAWKPVMLPTGDDAEGSEAAQARSGCPSE